MNFKILLTILVLALFALPAAGQEMLSEKQALNKLARTVNADGTAFNTVATSEVKVYGYEVVAPTTVDGAAVTVALAHRPVSTNFYDLSDTYQVRLVKGGAPAGASTGVIVEPGQVITSADGEQIFSVYGANVDDPASFQITSVYEVGL